MLIMIGAVIIAITAISRISSLSAKMRMIEWEIEKLKAALKPDLPKSPPAQPPVAPQVTQHLQPVQPVEPAKPVPPSPRSVSPQQPATGTMMPPAPVSSVEPSRTREEWESFVGGKLLNRIGALALVIGVGFFLKYAFDNDWITESMRVVIGLLTGIGILLVAATARRKAFDVFAQGLFGAGISILYLSVYASFSFYHLVSQPVAFGAMALVTAAAFAIALHYDSLAIALLAWAGGFLTPFLLSTGHANEVGLFTYIALLQAGLLAIVVKRPSWIILELLTLFGTYLVFKLWHDEYYAQDVLGTTVFFISVFWALFFLADLVMTVRRGTYQREFRLLAGLFNAGVYYIFMYLIVDPAFHQWMGGTTLAICLAYLSRVVIPTLRRPQSPKMLAQNVFTALVLLVLATAIQFKGFTTAIYWSLEALALVWCASRWNYRYVRDAALGLFLLALWKLFTTPGAFATPQHDEFTLLFNYRALAFVVLAVTMGTATMIIPREGIDLRKISMLHALWSAVVFVWITIEVNEFFNLNAYGMMESQQEFFEYAKLMTLMCCWTLYSLAMVYAGLKAKSTAVLTSGLVIATTALMMSFIRGIAFSPTEAYHPLANVRMLAVMVVLAGSYLHLVLLNQHRTEYEWVKDVASVLTMTLVLLLLWLMTGETRDFYEKKILFFNSKGDITGAENLKQLSLSGLWLIYGIALMVVGFARRGRGIRLLSMILLGISILKIFVYDLSFLETLYRIFSFIGLGVILLAASFLYQKYKAVILEIPESRS